MTPADKIRLNEHKNQQEQYREISRLAFLPQMNWAGALDFYRWYWRLFRQMPVDMEGFQWDTATIYEFNDENNGQDQELVYAYDSDLSNKSL